LIIKLTTWVLKQYLKGAELLLDGNSLAKIEKTCFNFMPRISFIKGERILIATWPVGAALKSTDQPTDRPTRGLENKNTNCNWLWHSHASLWPYESAT